VYRTEGWPLGALTKAVPIRHVIYGAEGLAPRDLARTTIGERKRKRERTMGTIRKVAVFIGSLRKGAFSRQTAKALAAVAPAGLHLEFVEIGQLPLYNQDDDGAAPPPAWVAFREKVKAADAVLFVTQ